MTTPSLLFVLVVVATSFVPSAKCDSPAAGSQAAPLPGPPLPEDVVIPRGSRDDVLLWKRALDAQNDLLLQRAAARALLRRFEVERPDPRLAAQALAVEPGARRARLVSARQKLGTAWNDVAQIMAKTWPVDPRLSCRVQSSDLEGVLAGRPGTPAVAGLDDARLALRACLGKLLSVLEPLRKGNQALDAAFADACAILGPTSSAPVK